MALVFIDLQQAPVVKYQKYEQAVITITREITPAQRKAVSKYESKNYDKVLVRMPKGERDRIKAHAESQDETLNGFVTRAIYETMERDQERGSALDPEHPRP